MAERSEEASPSEAASSPNHDERQSGNWWDSWLSSAKNKSAEVYSMVRKDLDEIGSAVKSEATHVFSTTSNVIGKTFKLDVPESPANVMKKSFSSFIGQVSTVLNPEPDDEDDTEVILSSGDTTMLSTYKKELEALQRVDATFIVAANSPEFDAWRASLESSEAGVIAPTAALRRLETSAVLKAQYQRLVPDAVSHEDFWERYLFRVALLQDRLAAAARRLPDQPPADPVLAHLPLTTSMPIEQSPKKVLTGLEEEPEEVNVPYESPDIDRVVSWEEEDFANDVELTEEQQTLLLEEYEKEIASKKTPKKPTTKDVANNNAQNTDNTNKNTGKANKDTGKPNKNTGKANKNTGKGNKSTEKVNKDIDKINKNETKGRSPKKVKEDNCGNIVEDYFGDKEVKDDASANSDESWEKEFELEDVEQKA